VLDAHLDIRDSTALESFGVLSEDYDGESCPHLLT
jgi:hypothetical protein